jgi:hypothetical protein
MRITRFSLLAVCSSALAVAVAGVALAKGGFHGEPLDLDTRLSHMTEQLGLSGQQQEDIRLVMLEQQAKLVALREQIDREGHGPELKEAVREAFMETRERIEAQLSDEQLEEFRERRWKHRGHARRGCGGGGGGEGDGSDGRL